MTQIEIESGEISNSIYKSNWYDFNGKSLRKNVIIFMEMTKSSIKFLAGGVYIVNMETYIAVRYVLIYLILLLAYFLLQVLKAAFSFYTYITKIKK